MIGGDIDIEVEIPSVASSQNSVLGQFPYRPLRFGCRAYPAQIQHQQSFAVPSPCTTAALPTRSAASTPHPQAHHVVCRLSLSQAQSPSQFHQEPRQSRSTTVNNHSLPRLLRLVRRPGFGSCRSVEAQGRARAASHCPLVPSIVGQQAIALAFHP